MTIVDALLLIAAVIFGVAAFYPAASNNFPRGVSLVPLGLCLLTIALLVEHN